MQLPPPCFVLNGHRTRCLQTAYNYTGSYWLVYFLGLNPTCPVYVSLSVRPLQ